MQRTVVLNVVGLTPRMLGPHAPNLTRLATQGESCPISAVTPAVTCSAQATYVTGALPRDHGIVANGWYFRDLSEVWLWRQSNRLVHGEKIWEAARQRDPSFTCAKMFWWYNMYSSADISVTPRPQYPADGRKLPDVYSHPPELGEQLQAKLGTFPLFRFWGPMSDIVCSEWIASATEHVFSASSPTLTLAYLPHLDYNLQRLGPNHPDIDRDVQRVDAIAGRLIDMATAAGARVVVLSEYGITEVDGAVLPNQALREAGLLAVRKEDCGEQLDAGASEAFAVADHQIAHVYVRSPGQVDRVARLLADLDGVEAVWGEKEKRAAGLDHARSGELVLISRPDRWFQYYYWLDDRNAPDYARTVDIHRKPGFDPVELFFDPKLRAPKLKAAMKVAGKKLGLRTLMNVIPLTPELVRGSHGRPTDDPQEGPLVITSERGMLDGAASVDATDIKRLVLRHLFE